MRGHGNPQIYPSQFTAWPVRRRGLTRISMLSLGLAVLDRVFVSDQRPHGLPDQGWSSPAMAKAGRNHP
jgi:hypothetical protein